MTRTLVAGALAGLGVALPLGAIGVLLLQEGRRGWAPAAGAATAVATVDGAYAAAAVLAGPQVATLLAGHETAVRAASALLLAAIAAHGLLGLRRPTAPAPTAPAGPAASAGPAAPTVPVLAEPAGPVGPAAPAVPGRASVVARAFLRFALLTAVNPTTALYFTALVTGRGSAAGDGSAAFVVGVFLASLAWQQVLAAAGALAGSRLGPRARRLTHAAGYGLVAVFAVRLALAG
ncbi:LysE type translocator [Kitasatospora sp. SolWspMP-SS2h]|uniref:LysE family transporter n=1 Tax=Kitasatospora sp. SolWspMP-SS2h TaxID=1305729 RepID=UPI000DB96D59|nr:LysE family transporter [Kitasatospora sp. SolWspMP-SS2h]RAJ44861.1 LysE type translocator [Kitasatospora sp. SolWspMP-SS2h]